MISCNFKCSSFLQQSLRIIVVLMFYLLYMCIKIEILCIAIFVTRRNGNTVIHLNQSNTPFWSPALSRDQFVRRLSVSVRSSICLSGHFRDSQTVKYQNYM